MLRLFGTSRRMTTTYPSLSLTGMKRHKIPRVCRVMGCLARCAFDPEIPISVTDMERSLISRPARRVVNIKNSLLRPWVVVPLPGSLWTMLALVCCAGQVADVQIGVRGRLDESTAQQKRALRLCAVGDFGMNNTQTESIRHSTTRRSAEHYVWRVPCAAQI